MIIEIRVLLKSTAGGKVRHDAIAKGKSPNANC